MNGMHLVRELEKDLKVANVICMVSQDTTLLLKFVQLPLLQYTSSMLISNTLQIIFFSGPCSTVCYLWFFSLINHNCHSKGFVSKILSFDVCRIFEDLRLFAIDFIADFTVNKLYLSFHKVPCWNCRWLRNY